MKKVKVGKSKIHGKGLFTTESIKKGDLILPVHSGLPIDQERIRFIPNQFGKFYNHDEKNFNTSNEIIGDKRYLRAIKNIPAGSELTANYKEHSEMEQPEDFGSGKYASFDFDKTIATPEGLAKAKKMFKDGYNLFIVSAREKVTPDMIARARQAGIPVENIIATGSDEAKVRKVKQLGVEKHFDDKPEVIAALGSVGEQFRKGGGVNSMKYTRSIFGKNKLFVKNKLFKPKKVKNRIYDPNAKYYQDGGGKGDSPFKIKPNLYTFSQGPDSQVVGGRLDMSHKSGLHGNITAETPFMNKRIQPSSTQNIGFKKKYKNLYGDATLSNFATPGKLINPSADVELGYERDLGKGFNANIGLRNTMTPGSYYNPSLSAGIKYGFQNGGINKTELTPEEEMQFQKFYNSLPGNLQTDDDTYDLRGYWDSERRPESFNYDQPTDDEGYYHAYSINSNTGEYLKSPAHETFQHAVDEDRKIGYRPLTNVYGRNIATENESIADPEQQSFLRNIEGPANYIETELTPEEIEQYRKGGYIVEEVNDPAIPTLNQFDNGGSPKSQWIAPAERYSGRSNVDPTTGLIYKDLGDLDVKAGKKGFKRKVQDFFRKDIGKLTKEAEELGKGVGYIAGVQGDIEPAVYNREGIKKFKSEVKRLKGDFNTELKDAEKKRKQEAKDREDYEQARKKAQSSKDPNAGSKFAREYEEKGWNRFDSAIMKEGYEGQFQDAVDEANARKTENYNLVRNIAGELSGYDAAGRIIDDPLGTLKGIGQTVGDVTTLPLGLAKGAYNYATNDSFDMGTNPLTGSAYGEGFDKAMDVMSVIPYVGAVGTFGKAAKLTKAADLVGDAGKFITTQTPLKNTYKLNPRALKENPEMYVYRARPVGQNPDMNMAATLRAKEAAGEPLNWRQKNIIKMSEGKVPDMGGIAAREKYYGRWFDKDPKNLDYYINPDTRNFADNDAIEILRSKLPKAEADKLKVSQFEDAKSLSGFPEREFILPKDLVNSAERFPESSWQQLIQEDKAFNTPHWLKGYKKVSTELPGSPNTSISGRLKQFFDRPPGPLMLGMPTSSGSNMVKKNMNYYKQLLDSYDGKKMSISDRKFYNSLIETGKKQDGMITEAQFNELKRLETGNFDFGKRGYNKESLVQVEPKAPVETPKSDFKSEIDWDKWNPEISKNPELLQEYNAIEEAAKADGTWMKNPDGSPFVLPDGKAGQHWTFTKGTPEQFVQMQSQNFKKAYPEGFDAWYTGRMKDPTEQFPLFAELYPEGRSIFGGDYHVATRYASTQPEGYDTFKRLTTEFKPKEITKFTDADQTAKVHGLISPKTSNSFLFNARKQGWREIPVGSDTGITPMWEGQPIENFRESLKTTFKNPKTGIDEKGYKVKSDDIAEHLEKNNMDYATIEDVVDGSVADYVRIHNLKSGNYPKSLWGNNGMFDLSNPNIYKAIIPTVGVTGLTGSMLANPFEGSDGLQQQQYGGALNKFKEGGFINYQLGDKVNEATKNYLESLGYTFEEI
jgi:hypothetical protein